MGPDLQEPPRGVAEWPRFTIRYTYDHVKSGVDGSFDADEVVLFDPTRKGGTHWIAAKPESVLPIEETR